MVFCFFFFRDIQAPFQLRACSQEFKINFQVRLQYEII